MAGIRIMKNKDRERVGFCKSNRVINNVVTKCKVPLEYFDTDNSSDQNVFSGIGDEFDFESWKETGLDQGSRILELEITFGEDDNAMSWGGAQFEPVAVDEV